MRKIFLSAGILLSSYFLQAQVGEVTSEEIVIEKDKAIVLPNADKLYLPVIPPDLTRDSIRLKFNLSNPAFNIGPYLPAISPFSYAVPAKKLTYQNFVKAGFGNYGSPVLTAYAGQELPQMSWGAWLHHESFASGSVRGEESASSTSMLDVFGTIQSTNWAFTPAIGWQSDAYRFYGYGDGDARITTDRSTLGRVKLAATVEEIRTNKLTLVVNPTYRSTGQNVPGDATSSKEDYFDFTTQASYQIDSSLFAGARVQLGAIGFNSPMKINRNFVRLNPWVGFKKSTLLIKAGFEVATTNDTIISGTSSYFYPDLSAEWSGLAGWTVYGALKGELKPITYSSLTYENYFLDDSLTMVHENVKTSFSGGIRGAISSRLFLNTGFRLSGIQNMSFFVPSSYDSARFTIAVDTKTITLFNWFGSLNWQPADYTHLSFNVDVYTYDMGLLTEAWNKPSYTLSIEWFQRYTEKITTQARLTSLGGIKSPHPITFEEEKLNAIVDLSLQANYQINERAEAFVQIQNLLSQQYQRYLNYPNRELQVRIGALYRF